MASQGLAHVKSSNERLQARIERIRNEHKTAIRQTMGAALTVGTAFGLGYLEERYPERMQKFIAGFPLSLIAGGGLILASGFEVGGEETAMYLGDAGRGALAAWAAGKGGEIGRKQLAAAPK